MGACAAYLMPEMKGTKLRGVTKTSTDAFDDFPLNVPVDVNRYVPPTLRLLALTRRNLVAVVIG